MPQIFHYWSNAYLRPKLESFGFSNPDQFFAFYLERAYADATARPARFISIGAGNCDTEVRVARLLIERGISNFTIESLLPPKRRYNRQLKRNEFEFMDWNCSVEGFEGIRAQDILPLLIERFDFEFFLGYANLIDPFIDRSFGHHFDAASAADRAFIDRIHARDEADIFAGRITPTHMMASMRRKSAKMSQAVAAVRAQMQIWQHPIPEFCLRSPHGTSHIYLARDPTP